VEPLAGLPDGDLLLLHETKSSPPLRFQPLLRLDLLLDRDQRDVVVLERAQRELVDLRDPARA